MNLYVIVADQGEMNLDWFVVADTPQEAAGLWKEIDTVQDFACQDEGTFEFPAYEVFLLPIQMDGPARTLDWHTDIPSVLRGEAS